MANEDYPKTLREDLEWSVEMIRDNDLYSGYIDKTLFDKNRLEIRAWLEIVNLTNI